MAVPENYPKWNCFVLTVYFHWRVHSILYLELCGTTGHVPATVFPSESLHSSWEIWSHGVKCLSIYLCDPDNLCHWKPKVSVGLRGGGIWASSGKVRPSKASRRRVGTFHPEQQQETEISVMFGDAELLWLSETHWTCLGQAGCDLVMNDLKSKQRSWNSHSSCCLNVYFCWLFLLTDHMYLCLSPTRLYTFSWQKSCQIISRYLASHSVRYLNN